MTKFNEITKLISSTNNEDELKKIGEKYSPENSTKDVTSEEQVQIYNLVSARWGELTNNKGYVVSFMIGKSYNLEAVVREFSMRPQDGIYRTRNVYTGQYAEDVPVMGATYGFEKAFKIIYENGKKIYKSNFDLETAQTAFLHALPFEEAQDLINNKKVDTWFRQYSIT